MDSEIQPQGIPQEILKNKKAIDLYKWSLWIIGAIVGGISGAFVQSVRQRGVYNGSLVGIWSEFE